MATKAQLETENVHLQERITELENAIEVFAGYRDVAKIGMGRKAAAIDIGIRVDKLLVLAEMAEGIKARKEAEEEEA